MAADLGGGVLQLGAGGGHFGYDGDGLCAVSPDIATRHVHALTTLSSSCSGTSLRSRALSRGTAPCLCAATFPSVVMLILHQM